MTLHATLGDDGAPEPSVGPITVTGECNQTRQSLFACVKVTVRPSDSFEVEDRVPWKEGLESLNVGWSDAFVTGMLEAFTGTSTISQARLKITLEDVSYHTVDSTWEAFTEAGRDAGRKIIQKLSSGGF